MTDKSFLNRITNGKSDIIQLLLEKIQELEIDYCVIGGLAVNAYVDPVASLDLDLVFAIKDMDKFLKDAGKKFNVEKFLHSINLKHPDSDLRIRLQTDSRYQDFISNAAEKKVLGYIMKVASIEDVLKGKAWAYSDEEKRKSKRQKDLADIMRLVEAQPHLYNQLPEEIKALF